MIPLFKPLRIKLDDFFLSGSLFFSLNSTISLALFHFCLAQNGADFVLTSAQLSQLSQVEKESGESPQTRENSNGFKIKRRVISNLPGGSQFPRRVIECKK